MWRLRKGKKEEGVSPGQSADQAEGSVRPPAKPVWDCSESEWFSGVWCVV